MEFRVQGTWLLELGESSTRHGFRGVGCAPSSKIKLRQVLCISFHTSLAKQLDVVRTWSQWRGSQVKASGISDPPKFLN